MVGAPTPHALRSCAVDEPHLQRDQPGGVPPLALTGERTLPDVPEENYWFRRHLAVYEWIAERVGRATRRRPRLRRGLRLGRARRQRGRGGRRRRQPGGPRARAAALPAAEPALRAGPGGDLRRAAATRSSSCRRSSTSTIPGRCWSGSPSSRRLPTSRPRTGSRWRRRGRRSPTTRGTCASTRRPSTASCSSPHFDSVEIYGLFHAAQAAPCTSSPCGSAGTASTRRCGLTKPFYDRFVPAIAASRLRAAGPRAAIATSTGRSTSSPSAGHERPGRRGGPGAGPPQPHALRRGLRHLPVRRGVAVRRGDPLLRPGDGGRRAADAVGHPGARRPARGRRRPRAPARVPAPLPDRVVRRRRAATSIPACVARAEAEADRYRDALARLERARRRPARACSRPRPRRGGSS